MTVFLLRLDLDPALSVPRGGNLTVYLFSVSSFPDSQSLLGILAQGRDGKERQKQRVMMDETLTNVVMEVFNITAASFRRRVNTVKQRFHEKKNVIKVAVKSTKKTI